MKRTILAAALVGFVLGCSGGTPKDNAPNQMSEEQMKAQKGRDAIINSGGKHK